jgi:para-aminobenzoate synthetase / 4-amino-4-deoxychorismate lyase
VSPRPVADPGLRLLETIRFTPAGGGFLLEEHLDRMAGSAASLGFACDRAATRSAAEAAAAGRGAVRVRLLLSRDGTVEAASAPLPAATGTLRVRVAREPVDAGDPMLRHKTTARGVYDARLAAHPGWDDVLLVNRGGELTESTIANLVVVTGGIGWTPPVDAGLLPGILRGDLLRRGRIRERTLRPADLLAAEAVYLINSVRLWRRAHVAR